MAHNGTVYIGGDSIASDGYSRNIMTQRKVFRVGEFLIGYTTSFRMGQLLEHQLDVRQPEEHEIALHYMISGFADAVRRLFKDNGFSEVNNNQERGGAFLVGYRGKLYLVQSDFSVLEYSSGIAACGAGEAYALGAMLALEALEPEDRIIRSLEVSAELCALVSQPFYVESISYS